MPPIWLSGCGRFCFRGEISSLYNLGSEDDLTIAELACQVARVFEPTINVQIAGHPTPDRLVERYIPSTRKAYADLKLEQTIDLQEWIKRTILWCTMHVV